MGIIPKLSIISLLFIITIGTGIWTNRSGKTNKIILGTIHKLAGIAGIIFTGIAINNQQKITEMQGIILALIISACLISVITIITGALLTRENITGKKILIVHTIVPILLIINTAVIFCLLLI